MSGITLAKTTAASIPTPAAGKVTVYEDTTAGPSYKDETGAVTSLTGPGGSQGPMGPSGMFGTDGDEGPEGIPLPGPAGATGSAGPTGPQGPMGPSGMFGLDGEDGIDAIVIPGPPGAAGGSATSPLQGAAGTGGATGGKLDFAAAAAGAGGLADVIGGTSAAGTSGANASLVGGVASGNGRGPGQVTAFGSTGTGFSGGVTLQDGQNHQFITLSGSDVDSLTINSNGSCLAKASGVLTLQGIAGVSIQMNSGFDLVVNANSPAGETTGVTGQALISDGAAHTRWGPPKLNDLEGVLGSDVALSAGVTATVLTTASLAVGRWLLSFTAKIINGGAVAGAAAIGVVVGTATATFGGPIATEGELPALTGGGEALDFSVVAIVTVAGTLILQANSAVAGTVKALGAQLAVAVTGYTAVEIA